MHDCLKHNIATEVNISVQILTPFMLRRVKSDVDLEIPPKKELLVYAPLTDVQRDMYEATVDRTILKKIKVQEVNFPT